MSAPFDESKIRRHAAGAAGGGRFAPKVNSAPVDGLGHSTSASHPDDAAAAADLHSTARELMPDAESLTFAREYTDEGVCLTLAGVERQGQVEAVEWENYTDDHEQLFEIVFARSGQGEDGSQIPGMIDNGDDTFTFRLD